MDNVESVTPFSTGPPCPLPPGWPAPPAEYAIVYSLGVGGWLGSLPDAPASGADWSVLLPTFRLAGVRCGLRLGPGPWQPPQLSGGRSLTHSLTHSVVVVVVTITITITITIAVITIITVNVTVAILALYF